jgi:hypothetical protein
VAARRRGLLGWLLGCCFPDGSGTEEEGRSAVAGTLPLPASASTAGAVSGATASGAAALRSQCALHTRTYPTPTGLPRMQALTTTPHRPPPCPPACAQARRAAGRVPCLACRARRRRRRPGQRAAQHRWWGRCPGQRPRPCERRRSGRSERRPGGAGECR